MKPKQIILVAIIFSLLFTSCGNTESYQSAPNSSAEAMVSADSVTTSSSDRKIIKTAEIKIQVDKVPDKIREIQTAVNEVNGQVFHFEINSNKSFLKDIAYNLDSSYSMYTMNPEGIMKVKIPKQYADTFINKMLLMNAEIDQLLINEQDITEDITEKKELIQSVSNRAEASNKLKNQIYSDEKTEETISRKKDLSKLNYRTSYLWFDIYLKGNTYLSKTKIASSKDLHEPTFVSMFNALESGWYFFSLFLTALLYLWPFIVFGIILFVGYKKKWFQLLRLK